MLSFVTDVFFQKRSSSFYVIPYSMRVFMTTEDVTGIEFFI